MKKADTYEINSLEKLAEEILTMKNTFRQRRPIVIEFCGSPKSGKSSCINSLNLFLKRNGFKTGIVTEQASVCPIKDKHNPTFNTWTVNSTISELNALLDPRRNEPLDIVICDRAIFDALCWFNWMFEKGTLEKEEYKTITDYITLSRWSNKIDLVYVFVAEPQVSIDREYAHLLTRKPGSIMNIPTLSEYIICINKAKSIFGDKFRMIQEIDTSSLDQNDVSKEVTHRILEKLKELLIERVGFVEKSKLKTVLSNELLPWNVSVPLKLDMVSFDRRDAVESNNNYLQLIPIGVLTDREHSKILVLKKQPSASKNSAEKGSHLLWFGGHMREEDKIKGLSSFEDLAKITLRREVEEELGIAVSLNEIKPFYIYSTAHEKSLNHLAVCFLIEKDLDGLKLSIDSYELVQNKGTSKSGTFMNLADISASENIPSEEWSRLILANIFGVSMKIESLGEQLTLDALNNK
ncbi:MAG: hypothetical protein RR769_08025 [Anaerovoracaceae bacterium]